MASNSSLIPVKDMGWLNGFPNLFAKTNHQWWRTRQWLVQAIIWMAIVNGMLAMVTLAAPKIEAAEASREIAAEEAGVAREGLAQTALMVFFVFSAMAPAVGAVIIGQDAIIDERQSGTAAWVLTKPVARPAFLLARLAGDAIGILVTMVVIQGVVAYFIYKAGTGISLSLPGFAAALGLVYLLLLFYLCLTLMLGTLFRSRGPVIGFSMLLVFGNNLTGLLPFLGKIMPWNLLMDVSPTQPSLAVALAQGRPLPTVTPIIGTAVLSLIFLGIALWRFQQEEF